MVNKITESKIIQLYLEDYSKKYYLGEFAKILNKPHQTIKPYVESLIKKNLFTMAERGRITEFGLNFQNYLIYDYLVIAEKEKLIQRLNEDSLLDILFEDLSAHMGKNTFIIFGSSAIKLRKGSDIDILVIGSKMPEKTIENFTNIYNKEVHIHRIKSLKEATKLFIKEVYRKHLILNNTESIVRYFGGIHEQNWLV